MVTRRSALAVALVAAACGGAPAPAAPPAATKHTGMERYLPLDDDTVYSYETYSEASGERGVLVLRVRRPRPDMAELDVAGRVQRLYVNEGGLELATGGHLLRAPLSVGAEWVGDFGKVRVTALDRAVRVPAGSFTRCVETVEEIASGQVKKRTLTVFCPEVGIALRETEGQAGDELAVERIELKSYGKAFSFEP